MHIPEAIGPLLHSRLKQPQIRQQLTNSLHIGDDVIILAQSGVTKDLKTGTTYFGTLAIENRQRLRELAALRKLGRGTSTK